MAVEGLRRSTRARKPVKSYAIEQAEEEVPSLAQPPKRKRKKVDDEYEDEDHDDDLATTQPAKKAAKKTSKKPKVLSPEEEKAIKMSGKVWTPKEGSSKPSDKSWHANAAERRITANKRNIIKFSKLQPGQEEVRLRG